MLFISGAAERSDQVQPRLYFLCRGQTEETFTASVRASERACVRASERASLNLLVASFAPKLFLGSCLALRAAIKWAEHDGNCVCVRVCVFLFNGHSVAMFCLGTSSLATLMDR